MSNGWEILPRDETPAAGRRATFYNKVGPRPWYKLWGAEGLLIADGVQPQDTLDVNVVLTDRSSNYPRIQLNVSVAGQPQNVSDYMQFSVAPNRTLRVELSTMGSSPGIGGVYDVTWFDGADTLGRVNK